MTRKRNFQRNKWMTANFHSISVKTIAKILE
jgi:hypothetical protein